MEAVTIAGTVLTGIGLVQSSQQHGNQKEEAIKGYQVGTHGDIIMTLVQTDSDISFARSEAERDFYDQKNQQLQTLIISASVMVGALITIFIQGILPDGTNAIMTAAFGATNGLSFGCLFLSIIYCLEISKKASEFMIARSQKQQEEHDVTQALLSKFFVDEKQLRMDHKWADSLKKKIDDVAKNIVDSNRRRIKNLSDLDWNSFWNIICKNDHTWAIYLFYSGSALLMCTCVIWSLAQFQLKYYSDIGGYLSMAPILLSIIIAIKTYFKYSKIPSSGFELVKYLQENKGEPASMESTSASYKFTDIFCCFGGWKSGRHNSNNSSRSRGRGNGRRIVNRYDDNNGDTVTPENVASLLDQHDAERGYSLKIASSASTATSTASSSDPYYTVYNRNHSKDSFESDE